MKQATESIDIRYRMDMENDILEELEEIKQTFLGHKARIQELKKQIDAIEVKLDLKNREIEANDLKIKIKNREIEANERELARKEREINIKNRLIAQLDLAIGLKEKQATVHQQELKIIAQNMHFAGVPPEAIARYIGVELSVIQEWLERSF